MKINSEKSKEIIISFAQDGNFRSTIPNIKIDGRDVAQVCHAKLLGVTISQDLTWNKHVDTIVKKAGKRYYYLNYNSNIVVFNISVFLYIIV